VETQGRTTTSGIVAVWVVRLGIVRLGIVVWRDYRRWLNAASSLNARDASCRVAGRPQAIGWDDLEPRSSGEH
jgi:hypothetical protein